MNVSKILRKRKKKEKNDKNQVIGKTATRVSPATTGNSAIIKRHLALHMEGTAAAAKS